MIAGIFLLALLATTALAWRRGAAPEKLAATSYLVAALASDAVVLASPHHHAQVEPGLAVIDAALLLGLALIAFRTDRLWPLISTALQLITVMGHVARALNPHVWRLAYAWMLQASAFPSLIVLAAGILLEGSTARSASRRSPASWGGET